MGLFGGSKSNSVTENTTITTTTTETTVGDIGLTGTDVVDVVGTAGQLSVLTTEIAAETQQTLNNNATASFQALVGGASDVVSAATLAEEQRGKTFVQALREVVDFGTKAQEVALGAQRSSETLGQQAISAAARVSEGATVGPGAALVRQLPLILIGGAVLLFLMRK